MKTTQQAFEELLNSPNAAEKMGIKQEQIYILRNRLKAGKVSINKMEQHLTHAGYQVAIEKTWFHLDEFKNDNGPVIEQLFKKYFSEYTKDEMNPYRLLDYIKEKQTPSFAPGGTITNSWAEVELPKESSTEYMSGERVIIKIDKTKDSETTNKVLAALNIEPEKLGEVYKSVPKESLKEKNMDAI
jgi:hypothetical protein